ncbi:hypothetical protein Tco_0487492 [Tanacetum coccineum]
METTDMGNTDKDCIDDSNSAMSKASVTTWDEIKKKMGARKTKTYADKAKGKRKLHPHKQSPITTSIAGIIIDKSLLSLVEGYISTCKDLLVNLMIDKVNIKFRWGLLGFKRLHIGFLVSAVDSELLMSVKD